MKPAEHDQHVAYVAGELRRYLNITQTPGLRVDDPRQMKLANQMAREIVQWVSSQPVPWWKRMYYALKGRNGGR